MSSNDELTAEILKIYHGDSKYGHRGIRTLYEGAKEAGLEGVTLKKVREALKSSKIYGIHSPSLYKFPRNRISAHFPGHIVCVDLMDLSRFKQWNKGFVMVFLAAVKSDQFEDLETPSVSILIDEEPEI